ncbi:MAG: 3-hydroxyacyl-CoA dehydrogenase NAD-binding domain-containing protein, partial [Planctomycetota bacterium]
METLPINNVCVVGSGFMGSQIGLQCAVHGRSVWMHDVSESALAGSAQELTAVLEEQIEGGAAKADERRSILDRIRRTTSLDEAAADADLVIEAVKEDLDVKREVFRWLDEVCPPRTILTTNSSSLRISR